MVFEGAVDTAVTIVTIVGLPLLIALFYAEGLIIGKLVQPPAVFVAVIAVTTPSLPILLVLCVACTLAVLAGQWTVYRSFDADSPPPPRFFGWLPTSDRLAARTLERLGERSLRIIERFFDRYGGTGVFISVYVPGMRGTLAIPAGISSYPPGRFLLVTGFANTLYFPLLVAVAYGLLQALGLAWI